MSSFAPRKNVLSQSERRRSDSGFWSGASAGFADAGKERCGDWFTIRALLVRRFAEVCGELSVQLREVFHPGPPVQVGKTLMHPGRIRMTAKHPL